MAEINLEELGFGKNEKVVYLALFELGKCRAGKIVEKTALHRNLVYTALDELEKRGLISKFDDNGVAAYQANNPDFLVREAKQKMVLAENIVEQLAKMGKMPVREVSITEGYDSIIEQTFNKIVDARKGDTLYVLGGNKDAMTGEIMPALDKFHKKRMRRGIKYRALYDSTVDISHADRRNAQSESEVKYLPFETEMPVWFTICNDAFSIMIADRESPLAINVRSKPAAEAMRKYFNFLWNFDQKKEKDGDE